MILSKYQEQLNVNLRFPSMELAIRWFDQHGGTVAVETGCMRLKDDWGGGCSTLVFGEAIDALNYDPYLVTNTYKRILYSVDISAENIATAKSICGAIPVTFAQSDSVAFLKSFDLPIDFLYLDSLDCHASDEANNKEPQQHQLAELQAAWDKLTDKAVVLLDDCGFSNGGKGRLTRAYLKDKGWKELWDGYQSLWVR